MKKSLFISLCCSFFLVSSLFAETYSSASINLQAGRDKSVRPTSVGETVIPIAATIDVDLVTLSFSSNLGNSTVTIENSLGEVVYENTLNAQAGTILPISLAGSGSDTYYIEINSGSKKWFGEFDL